MRIEGLNPEQWCFRLGFERARPHMVHFNGGASEWAMERKPGIRMEGIFGSLIINQDTSVVHNLHVEI